MFIPFTPNVPTRSPMSVPLLPPSAEKVGFIGAPDDCDFSLWLPLGSRQVEHFLVSDPPERFQRLNVQYVVLGGLNLCDTIR